MSLFPYLYDLNELPLDVPLDDGGLCVLICQHLQRHVDGDFAVHREEPVDGVGQVDVVQGSQGHRRVDLKELFSNESLPY